MNQFFENNYHGSVHITTGFPLVIFLWKKQSFIQKRYCCLKTRKRSSWIFWHMTFKKTSVRNVFQNSNTKRFCDTFPLHISEQFCRKHPKIAWYNNKIEYAGKKRESNNFVNLLKYLFLRICAEFFWAPDLKKFETTLYYGSK